jgi:hypothetical protein
MSALELRQAFRRRFRAVARQIWSLHVGRGVARTVLVAAVVVAMFATADYFFELSWAVRAGILAAVAGVVAILTAVWVVRPALAWDRAKVATELEGLFPRLGQRLRTATQHGERSPDELAKDGVAPGLVAALEEETAEKVKPLPFQAALPVRPVLIVGGLAIVCVAAVAAVAALVPEWRTALGRVALSPAPYTTLTATASADSVIEGTNVDIRATMSGRARPAVVLHVREAGETDWREESMDATDGEFTAQLPKLRATSEFFVSAGPERTSVKQIVVRHPLKIVSTHVEVTSPAYTGVALANYDTGSFSAIQGSTAKIQFELDRQPTTATLLVKDPTRPTAAPRRLAMAVQDRHVSVELPLAADLEYAVYAMDTDGMTLVANRHRVRVTADQPPSVWFETPGEGLEVHTLAEIVIRARARDDFGLSKVGIVFQINNEEERTLVLYDVNEPNQREAKAEEVLMLEQYLLTQKDCVAYYAFAEDARPSGPQRTTTELRFIDIRPFKRTYRVNDDPDGMPNGQQRDIILLDEVIARQRFNLNQTIRLEARANARSDVAQVAIQVDKVAAFENKLATQTHDLADFLSGLGVDGAAILSLAEEAMLASVDSLNGAKFTTAINQERDALRFLMEARNTVQQALSKQPKSVRAQARAFDRLQRQKLRRPNAEAETLAQIAEELRKLADDEDEVARTIAGAGNATGMTNKGDNGDPKTEPKNGKGGMDPAQERQDDIAGRATAIEKVAANVKGLTELAKSRIGEAAKAANAGADALGMGDRPTARTEVERAKELFRTAAKQVAALAADEPAQQLAMARDIANDIALKTAPSDMKNGGGGGNGDEKKTPVPGGMGDKNDGKMQGIGNAAEQAKTLKDVLEKLAGSGVEADADAARKAGAILKQEDLGGAIGRLEKPGVADDKAERQDLADRFAALGQKLDQAYRETVAPRLEEIARLEREANELEKKFATADDDADMRRLRQQTAEFVEHLEAAGLGELASKDLREGLKGVGQAGSERFGSGIAVAHSRLVAKLQEFVAADKFTSGNEAVPPEYKDLVERYLRALSAGSSK